MSGSFGIAWGNLGAPRGRRVHSSSRKLTRASLETAGFIRGHVGPLGHAEVFLGLVGFVCVRSGAPSGFRVHSVSRRFTQSRVGVAGFIRDHVRSIRYAYRSPI